MRVVRLIIFYILSVSVGLNFVQCDVGAPPIHPKLEKSLEDIMNRLSAIEAKLESLQVSFEKKISSVGNDCSIRDISEAIKGHKFKMAEEQVNEIADERQVYQIVHNAYAGSPANLDILLDFARELSNSDVKLQVMAALGYEMRGHNDPLRLITLAEAMERELARAKTASAEAKTKAQDAINTTIEDIKAAATNILKTAMIGDKYQKNVEIENISSGIFKFRTDVSVEVMERVVDGLFGVVAAGKILDNISSHKHVPLVITGLKAIFNRFNYAGNLNTDATLDLASHLAKLKRRDGYKVLDRESKKDVNSVIERLPNCARSIYFSKNVCLWNKARNEYMYAADTSISYDKKRRSIYSWYTGDIVTGAIWQVEKIGKYYFFKNDHHANEYLYSVNGGIFTKDMRHVLTWIAGNNTNSQSEWTIELADDYCFIKSVFNDEYLFASSSKYNRYNAYVFTWIGQPVVRGAEFQWQMRDCGTSHD